MTAERDKATRATTTGGLMDTETTLGTIPPTRNTPSVESPSEERNSGGYDGGYGAAEAVNVISDIYCKILAICTNVAVIAELCIAMYFAAQDESMLTPVFFKVFLSLLLPTLVVSGIIRWYLHKRR